MKEGSRDTARTALQQRSHHHGVLCFAYLSAEAEELPPHGCLLLSPCPSIFSYLFLLKPPRSFPFPTFGSSSKHPIIGLVQPPDALFPHPIPCPIPSGSNPLTELLGFPHLSRCFYASLCHADEPLITSANTNCSKKINYDLCIEQIVIR